MVLTAHPSKSGGDWWYGTLIREKKSGFFPQTYVERVQTGVDICNIWFLLSDDFRRSESYRPVPIYRQQP